jgi:hyperosmotically inducible periplasmic protein
VKEIEMNTRFGKCTTLAAAIATAFALSACDQRNNMSSARPSDTTTAPASDVSQKMAATTDKVGTAVDDTALTAKVKAALLAEPGLKSMQIGVDTKNASVTLSGSVDSTASRDRAKEVASTVAGVATVVDQLTIKS